VIVEPTADRTIITHRTTTTRGTTMRTLRTRAAHAAAALRAHVADERGDVPGWVLITLMTAGLVLIIWALAEPALSGVFDAAIARVMGY
jgi:hypothetical protein